jgi:hypothetical protein
VPVELIGELWIGVSGDSLITCRTSPLLQALLHGAPVRQIIPRMFR